MLSLYATCHCSTVLSFIPPFPLHALLSKYGDLAATIAAVLLDPEARSVSLDADPFKGNIREPLLRLMSLMRGMELQLSPGQPIVKLLDLDYKIGMMAHCFRSVFSFMLPEYVPGGRPREATLVAPEAMLMDMPKVGKLFFARATSL